MIKIHNTPKANTLQKHFLKTSYASILFCIVITSLIFSVVLYSNSRKYADTTSRQTLARISQNTTYIVNNLDAFIVDFCFNEDVQDQLCQYSAISDQYHTKLIIDRYWRNYANTIGNEVSNAAIFALNGDMVGSLERFNGTVRLQNYSWYQEAKMSMGETLWLPSVIDESNPLMKGYAISVVKKIRAINLSIGRDLGYMLVYLDVDALLESVYAGYRQSEQLIFLTDSQGAILAHPDTSLIGTVPLLQIYEDGSVIRYNNHRYLFYSTKIAKTGWNMISLTEVSSLMRAGNVVLLACAISSIALLVVFWFISKRNAKVITQPIIAIQNRFADLEKGKFDVEISANIGIVELDDLVQRYNVMVQRLDSTIYENYEAKLREQTLVSHMKEAEMESLQMQINPHFLYNTLDSINWLALKAGNKGVSKMILALGNLFRYNINVKKSFTTIESELKCASDYLYIQSVRFNGKLCYFFHQDPEVAQCKVLRFLLQPLIENSIIHGIEPCKHNCTLHISIRHIGESLSIEVADDGVGIPQSLLEEIQHQNNLIQSVSPNHSKIGLSNIMKRLYLCYQGNAKFSIESTPDSGTRVTILLPYEQIE